MYDRGASEKRAIRTALVTKRYLVRVCKQWHVLAVPFLYESIYIGWWHVLPSLRDTLLESERRSREGPDDRPALGWWTLRLDVAIRTANTNVEKGFLNSPGYYALVDIIHCLPHLETFSSRWMPNFLEVGLAVGAPSPVAEALKQTCCASLRRIFWPDVSESPERIDGLLAALPSLVTLSHFDTPMRCPLYMPFPPTLEYLSLPNCAKFHVDPPGPPNPTLPCPSLRQISLHDYEQSDLICLHRFLAVQGATVSTVYIYIKHFRGTLRPSINILNHHCPNLQHLVTVFRKWMPFPDSTNLLTVTYLGLYLPDQGCDEDYRVIFTIDIAMHLRMYI
ncbi:hypothetical protein EWM64_g1973 [Hericium alpestre]|uniref:F-box domain-containing protein n=1 Tax=Hericium alpestre TaxID=135208 RepID=A0A4Z0A7Y4_9AGAM|nr:hypothetical protein EWM64_g1973 [Hericium alpestre]